jgi:DnaJ-class molecular chaperone
MVTPSSNQPKEGTKLSGKREDGQKCSGTFIRKVVADADLDFYEVLGVDEDVSTKDLKKAYRDLAKLYHPDKCTGTVSPPGSPEPVDCATAMNRVNLANEVLGDENKRILYDAGGMEMVKQGVDDGQQQQHDPFAALFGGGRQQRTNRGPDASVSREVTLEDIYNGNQLEMKINRRVVCRGCAGDKAKGKAKCASCGKCPDEVKMVHRQMGPGMIVQQEERVASKEKCKTEDTTLSATIERGVSDGAEIKFPRKSEQAPGQVPGDVIMTLKQKKHELYTRHGNDLHVTLSISLKEALLGFSKTLKHLDDHEVEVERDGTTKPNLVMKLKGEGMPVHNFPSDFGDLHVTIVVEMPPVLNDAQKKAIASLF